MIPTIRTTTDFEDDRADDLKTFEPFIQPLIDDGIDPQRLLRQAMVTPMCGLAFVSHQAAKEILSRATRLANGFKTRGTACFAQEGPIRIS